MRVLKSCQGGVKTPSGYRWFMVPNIGPSCCLQYHDPKLKGLSFTILTGGDCKILYSTNHSGTDRDPDITDHSTFICEFSFTSHKCGWKECLKRIHTNCWRFTNI